MVMVGKLELRLKREIPFLAGRLVCQLQGLVRQEKLPGSRSFDYYELGSYAELMIDIGLVEKREHLCNGHVQYTYDIRPLAYDLCEEANMEH